jgi:hypothetical protein
MLSLQLFPLVNKFRVPGVRKGAGLEYLTPARLFKMENGTLSI